MDKSPLFSIIIPAYQRLKFLAAAIESITVQSYDEWELIVVDDGSEPPLELGEAFFTNTRTLLLCQDNQGPATARKFGAEQSKGRYICFLDDDDYFLPDHLAILADFLETYDYPEAIIRTPLAGRYPDDRIITYPNFDNSQDALLQYWQAPCGITSLAFPRSVIFRKPIDPQPRIIEDFEWVSRVLVEYPLLQVPGEATVIYRQHETNRTLVDASVARVKERITVIQQAYAEPGVAERVPKQIYQKLLTHQWFHTARQVALSGEKKRAVSLLRQAIRCGGWRQVRQVLATVYRLF